MLLEGKEVTLGVTALAIMGVRVNMCTKTLYDLNVERLNSKTRSDKT